MPHSVQQRVFATCTSASGQRLGSDVGEVLVSRTSARLFLFVQHGLTCSASLNCLPSHPLSTMAEPHVDVPVHSDAFEQRLREREHLRSRPLETIPEPTALRPHGTLPNTPLAVSTTSFLLGSIFSLGFSVFLCGGLSSFWFATYQLAFFVASWSAFHWGEFAVTAGWNREKVSVDCTYFLSWSLDKRT
jgi:hypothetical protein